ncbi:AAA family ATPase [bacterium]|nr:AAA family ATPase [bacterium]
MRPLRLSLKNFGPYRELAEVDFSALGEFFLICGKTGSGKSTIFDAIAYALFGQAPGARSGHEADLVSDFAQPGDEPVVAFEFALSGTVYRVVRTAPFTKPKRGGGFTVAPPAASVFAADPVAEGGWRALADGVRDANEMLSALIGLTADEFSKIILLPQGEFQQFLEMESTKRSEVLEKLFPVELYDRVAEIAKARVQEARAALAAVGVEIERLGAEAGEEPEGRLAELKAALDAASRGEAAAAEAVSSGERALERGREKAERSRRALDATETVRALEARGAEEAARAARISAARAAAAVDPFARAFAKSRAAALELEERAARLRLAAEELEAAAPEIDRRRVRVAELASLAEAKQGEVFGLQKALEAWKRRVEAFSLREGAERRARELEVRLSTERSAVEALKAELSSLRPSPEEEAAPRAEIERLQAAEAAIGTLSAQAKRRVALFADLAAAETSRRGIEASYKEAAADRDRLAEGLAAMEASLAHSAAIRLASDLKAGKPCPVCGSTSHPAPATAQLDFGGASQGEVDASRAAHVKAASAAAALEASLGHAASRAAEKRVELAEQEAELSSGLAALGDALLAVEPAAAGRASVEWNDWTSGFGAEASAEFGGALSRAAESAKAALAERKSLIAALEDRRRLAAAKEKALATRAEALEALRAETERASAELARRAAVLEETERDAGLVDPSPALETVQAALGAFKAERARLEAECAAHDKRHAEARASLDTLGREREARLSSVAAEWSRLAEVLAAQGFLSAASAGNPAGASGVAEPLALLGEDLGGLASAIASAAAPALPPAALGAEERAAAAYREALSAAKAAADSLLSDLPAPGSQPPDLAALESALRAARAAQAEARERTTSLRLDIGRLEETLSRRDAALARRKTLDEGSRTLYRLSELLQGEVSGKRLTFKNFVLATYFREVVQRASAHLARMSDGRYYLRPDESQATGRGKIGLGLKVLDAWTGQDRPTTTLSGGEKFLTSISLALGLADSIREQNGGVSLDAVFIDEGFGSLDDEALDRAITVLDRIRGSRVIGIVSHVGGLRARIPARIEVQKTAAGSRLIQTSDLSEEP